MASIKGYLLALGDPRLGSKALRVALVVGTLLFLINHGAALVAGAMTWPRWAAAGLTYLVPYAVNIHGQYTALTGLSPGRRASQ